MSASYSLDAIREAADARYGHTEIVVNDNVTVRLLNPLRLHKDARKELLGIQDALKGDDVDQAQVFADALLVVAEDKGACQILLDAVNGDLAILAEIFKTYTEGTSAGEASASVD